MQPITVETVINAPIDKIWDYWNNPEHITKWAFASEDWHVPTAENDIRTGGKFKTRMEAKDGSAGFDFEGSYTEVKENELVEYVMSDGRKVKVEFEPEAHGIKVKETFDAEEQNSAKFQRAGWQAILENFKNYVEGN
jgi:uncharacterized protein YndB with AHSA1/START domain